MAKPRPKHVVIYMKPGTIYLLRGAPGLAVDMVNYAVNGEAAGLACHQCHRLKPHLHQAHISDKGDCVLYAPKK